VDGAMEQIASLVDHLNQFCHGHLERDRGAAASEMLGFLRRSWPEVPTITLEVDPSGNQDAEALALGIVRDVGEIAAALERSSDPESQLAWSRADLITALEDYLTVARPQSTASQEGTVVLDPWTNLDSWSARLSAITLAVRDVVRSTRARF
jgi:hypothetical protein